MANNNQKKKVTDKEIVKTINEAIDQYGEATKSFIGKIFYKMVEKTAEKFSEIFDENKTIIKRKLEEKNDTRKK